MKRQRSRNRGGGGGGGGKPSHNINRAFDSNGPDGVKIRGHAQHVFEKYQQLARDAQSAGDRVLAENYLQHAEHYFRVLRAVQPTRPASEIIGRDAFTNGLDIDFEDESGAQAAAAAAAEAEAAAQSQGGAQEGEGGEPRQDRGDYQRQDRDYQNRDRYEGRRDDRSYRDNRDAPRQDYRDNRQDTRQDNRSEGRRDDRGYRDERPRDDRPRDERPKDERPRDERPRDERPRDERPRDDRRDRYEGRRDDRRDRYEPRGERNGSDAMAVVEPQATPLVQPSEPRSSSRRSRGAAPVEAAGDEGSPMLRSQDGGVSHAPAFLQQRAEVPAPEAAEAPAAPKRRGRPPRAAAAAPEPAEEA